MRQRRLLGALVMLALLAGAQSGCRRGPSEAQRRQMAERQQALQQCRRYRSALPQRIEQFKAARQAVVELQAATYLPTPGPKPLDPEEQSRLTIYDQQSEQEQYDQALASWQEREQGRRARRITPKLLAQCLQYTRNLTLIERGFTPQLATIVVAAKQMAGDAFAIQVLDVAKEYQRKLAAPAELPELSMGLNAAAIDGELFRPKSRLPGPPLQWSRLELEPRPNERQRQEWSHRWNPY